MTVLWDIGEILSGFFYMFRITEATESDSDRDTGAEIEIEIEIESEQRCSLENYGLSVGASVVGTEGAELFYLFGHVIYDSGKAVTFRG